MNRTADPAFARALAFERALVERMTEVKEPFRWGHALLTPSLPDIYDLNFVRVEVDADAITAQALAAESDRLMTAGGYSHRKVIVEDEDAGARVAAGFAEMNWRADKLTWMVHRRQPERVAAVDVDEIDAAVHAAAKDEFNRRDPYFVGNEVIRQMRGMAGLVSKATDKRCFAAYVDGTIAAVCELYSDGAIAQIEDVATLEEYRGRGLATAVVLRALSEAQIWNHEMVFLVADADDWPKELYAKLGFEAVGATYQFLLAPDAPPDEPTT